MVRDRAGLDQKRARELEGQARFRMMEHGYEDVCQLHGGRPLEEGLVPGTKLKVFQPFMRFDASERGVILGLAAMPAGGLMPAKNMSRLAAVTLNYCLSPRFDFDGAGPKVGDVFALLLASRDRGRAGLLDELAVGVVQSDYSSFLFYERLDEFLAGGSESDVPPITPVMPSKTQGSSVTLKKTPKKFIPPDAPPLPEEDADEN